MPLDGCVMTVVVGIDPSLTVSGCARLDLGVGDSGQLEPLRWETWRAKAQKPEQVTVVSMRRRIRVMLREALAFVPDFFDLAVVEGPSFGSRHQALGDERGGLRWMLIDQLLARGPVAVVAPRTRALMGSGSGGAGKADVRAYVGDVFPAAHVPDDNVADAVVLAAMGAHRLGMAWPVDLSKKQVSAVQKVPWPDEVAA